MSYKPTKIMLPTDFSDLSLQVVPYARAIRKQFGAQLHVVHVWDMLSDIDTVVRTGGMIPLSMYETIGVEVARQRAEICGRARNRLHTLVAGEFDCNEEVVSQVLTGVPWQAVCRYEHKAGIDLIILATQGRTGLRRMLMGSTAERIVRYARCPVLTIKPLEMAIAHDLDACLEKSPAEVGDPRQFIPKCVNRQ